MYLYRYVDSKKYVKLHNNKIIFSLLLILLLDTISYYINNINISILMLIITVTYSILINMRNIKLLIELMKNKCKNIIKRVTNNIRNNDYKKFFGHKRNIKINFLKFIKYNNC